jgi:glycosyltransferase involved in cell wall biosynthesis
LFPSEKEACPNTVVEALACGLPVLYHDSGGTRELCRRGQFGIPIPSLHEDYRRLEGLLHLAREKHARMRASIMDDIETFSFSHCFDQYVQHFKNVLA